MASTNILSGSIQKGFYQLARLLGGEYKRGFSLLTGLPVEIRYTIYELVFEAATVRDHCYAQPIRDDFNEEDNVTSINTAVNHLVEYQGLQFGLLQASKQIRAECLPVWEKSISLKVSGWPVGSQQLPVPLRVLRQVRFINLENSRTLGFRLEHFPNLAFLVVSRIGYWSDAENEEDLALSDIEYVVQIEKKYSQSIHPTGQLMKELCKSRRLKAKVILEFVRPLSTEEDEVSLYLQCSARAGLVLTCFQDYRTKSILVYLKDWKIVGGSEIPRNLSFERYDAEECYRDHWHA